MKSIVFSITLAMAASTIAVMAQDPATSPGAPVPRFEKHGRRGPGGPGGPGRAAMEALTPAERQQLQQARKKAMESPEVAELRRKADKARKAGFEEMKAELLKQDPSLGPILEKVQKPGDFKTLSPEEREKVQAARKATRPGPKAFGKAAPAEKEFRDALHAAMLKADPTIAPILEKLEAARKEKRPGHPGDRDKNNPADQGI